MASLAESSVASVPIPRLALLQEHLLQHCQSTHDAPQVLPEATNVTKPSGHDYTKQLRDSSAPTNDVTTEIPDSADAYRTPTSSPAQHPPRLSSSKSAPAAEMEAMIQPSPSQKAFAEMTRASSFHGFPGGDTQPMESQVYRDYNESMWRPAAIKTPLKDKNGGMQVTPDGKSNPYDTNVTEKTPQTCVEGETGYIDLAQAWQPGSPAARSTSDIDELLASPERLQTQDAVVKPGMLGTPAMAGRKRNSDGDIVSSTTAMTKRTPGLSQFFVQNGPMLSATQLFNQTQAPSSPMPDGPRSDPVMTRPSPNLHDRRNVSSPFATTSSPVLTMHNKPASTDPRDNYMSMRESQERRAARLRAEMGLAPLGEDDEDHDYSQQRRLEQMRMQRALSDQDLNRFRAPPRAGSRPSSSRKAAATVDLVTPATTHRLGKVDFDLTSDVGSDENVVIDKDEHVETDEQDENDMYDELNQAVLRSQSNPQDQDDGQASVKSDSTNDVNSDSGSVADEDHDEDPQGEGHAEDDMMSDDAGERHVAATQGSAIADSQPGRSKHMNHLVRGQPTHHSSMLSFVPGSQYAGKTSQDQVRLTHIAVKGSSASQMNEMHEEDKVPSSPPLPQQSSIVPGDMAEASLARREMLTRFQPSRGFERDQIAVMDEIPESDLPGSDSVRLTSNPAGETAPQRQGDSNTMAPYSTAPTHLSTNSATPVKPGSMINKSPSKALASQQSQQSAASPRRAAGIRRFESIAADPSPPDLAAGVNADIDAVMEDMVTADDQQFLDVTSSPPSERVHKRRRFVHEVSKQASGRTSMRQECEAATARNADHQAELAEGLVAVSQRAAPETTPQAEAHHPSDGPQSSPFKANQRSTPDTQIQDAPKGTQESVKRREAAGAHAVSQILSGRSKRSASNFKARKQDAIFPTSGIMYGARAKVIPKQKKSEKTVRSLRHNAHEVQADVDRHAQDNDPADTVSAQGEVAVDEPEGLLEGAAAVQDVDSGTAQIEAPHRVFAHFGGAYNAFYPATWLASNADGSSHRVRFDDTTVASVHAHQIIRLDLRTGDQIKIDGPGLRNKAYVVQGFGPVAQTDEDKALGTDVYGRVIVKVQAKTPRSSVPSNGATASDGSELMEVLLANIYITNNMWPQFADRVFKAPANMKRPTSRAGTPPSGLQTPNVETPGSRSRRTIMPSAKSRTSNLREESVASFGGSRMAAGIFSGMAFAISYSSNEDEKAAVTRHIHRQGGLLLENGFDELFELSEIDSNMTATPLTKRSPRKSFTAAGAGPNEETLCLKPAFRDLGFVALIADRHSRRAKYMQALALGLPSLSGKWIMDSLNPEKNKAAETNPLAWAKYLLPAGESTYLGAVRSRSMPAYSASEAKLYDTISARENFLQGDGVLIVAALSKKGNSAWQRRKAYAFLTLALGAGKIKRVSDLDEAKAAISGSGSGIEDSGWKWVYVDGSVADAGKHLLKQHARAGDKKRKLDTGQDVGKGRNQAMSVGDGNVKVVNDEYVVQSLILGALVD